jgi:hypothetical protein
MKPWGHKVEVILQTPLLGTYLRACLTCLIREVSGEHAYRLSSAGGISSSDLMMAFTLDGVIENMTKVRGLVL